MASPILDTSVFSTYKNLIDQNIDSFYFSTVVLYELISSHIDESTLQKYESWEAVFRRTEQLITPSKTDWIETAKAVRRLRHLKLINRNLSSTALQNDALIAQNALVNKCFVVTDNIRDFTLLQKVMPKLEVMPAKAFFN
jgi:Predicted nucleic acid-binding protein, contains PIN domain